MRAGNLFCALAIATFSCACSESYSEGISEEPSLSPTNTSVVETQPHILAQEFVGNCAHNMPQTEKVAAYARLNEWQELSEDMLAALSPADPSAKGIGWVVNVGSPNQYFIATSQASMDGDQVVSCTMAIQTDEKSEVIYSVVNTLANDRAPQNEFVEAGQRYRSWSYENLGEQFQLMVMDAPEMAPKMASISSMHIQDKVE